MEEPSPWASAVVIKGNKIPAVPVEDDQVDAFIGPGTRAVDLAGAFVLPGFIHGQVVHEQEAAPPTPRVD